MAQLCVRLFGELEARAADGSAALRFSSGRSRELFAILLVEQGRNIPQDMLIERLWPEDRQPEHLRRALNNELWRLRHTLSQGDFASEFCISRSAGGIRLAVGPDVDVDLHRFSELVADMRAGRADSERAAAVDRTYTGDLLPDFYADWAILAREAVRADFVFALEQGLGAAMRQRCWPDAVRFAQRILRAEPLLEHVHRQLMKCRSNMGDRAAALAQFRELEALLRRELECAPMPETIRLFESVRGDGGGEPLPTPRLLPGPELMVIAEQLERAGASLYAAAEALKRLERSPSVTE